MKASASDPLKVLSRISSDERPSPASCNGAATRAADNDDDDGSRWQCRSNQEEEEEVEEKESREQVIKSCTARETWL